VAFLSNLLTQAVPYVRSNEIKIINMTAYTVLTMLRTPYLGIVFIELKFLSLVKNNSWNLTRDSIIKVIAASYLGLSEKKDTRALY
jgi:hypothetical protein